MSSDFTIALTNQDLIRAQRLYAHDAYVRQRSAVVWVALTVLAFVVLGLVSHWRLPLWLTALLSPICVLFGLAFGYSVGQVVAWFVGRRALEQSPVLQRRFQVSWDKTGLTYRGEDGDQTRYRWADITRVARSRHIIILYLGPRIFTPIPLRFLGDTQAQALWDQLQDARGSAA